MSDEGLQARARAAALDSSDPVADLRVVQERLRLGEGTIHAHGKRAIVHDTAVPFARVHVPDGPLGGRIDLVVYDSDDRGALRAQSHKVSFAALNREGTVIAVHRNARDVDALPSIGFSGIPPTAEVSTAVAHQWVILRVIARDRWIGSARSAVNVEWSLWLTKPTLVDPVTA